jgi:hypothetical protein
MKLEEMVRTILYNVIGAAILVICYSGVFLGLSVSDRSAFRATCAVMIGPVVVLALLVYDYRHLIKNNVTVNEADDSGDMEYLLDKYRSTIFARQAAIIKGQLRLFEKRNDVFKMILKENALEEVESFGELTGHLERQLLLNAQKALRIMQVFNYDRYRTQGEHADPSYREQIVACNAYVETNERILTQFDALISEISKIGEAKEDDSLRKAAELAQSLREIRMAEGKDSEIEALERKYV